MHKGPAGLLLVMAAVASPLPASGQEFPHDNGAVLAGATYVDARVRMRSWSYMPGDHDDFQSAAEDKFHDALRANGIRIGQGSVKYLLCDISARRLGDVVAYYVSTQYLDYQDRGVHQLLWVDGGIGTTTGGGLTPELAATHCTDFFMNEWRKHNN